MTRILMSLALTACLLTPHLACRGAQRAGENEPPAGGRQNKPEDAILVLRDMLYCDKSLDEAVEFFAGEGGPVHDAAVQLRAKDYGRALATLKRLKSPGESGDSMAYWLALAAAYRGQGKLEEARAAARHLVSDPEARVAAQGWTVLRELGEAPPPQKADEPLGVVVEIAFDEGVAIIAGYADGRARYFGSNGGGFIGEGQPEPVQRAAKALTQAAARAARKLNPSPRRDLPSSGNVRVTVLTPAGGRAADEKIERLEEETHPLSGVYLAANKLFLELKKTYENK